jgi:hypothetical protein
MRVPLDTAAAIAEVKPATVRQWVHRGIIRRYDDGYDVTEILLWLDQHRSPFGLRLRNRRHADSCD